jgi:hypothetical protein
VSDDNGASIYPAKLRKNGDPEGSRDWQRIMRVIEKLQAERPAPGEVVQ